MTLEQRKSRWGPPEEYPARMRQTFLHIPFAAIEWRNFPHDELRELVEILGGNSRQASRRRLESEARKTVYRFQRQNGLHRRGPDLVEKIAPAAGRPRSAAVAIAKKKQAWR